MSLIQWIKFDEIGDERGSLVALESTKNIPFAIQRVYYLFGLRGDIPRGFHAHRQLKQLAICVSGRCEILMDNGIEKKTVTLESPSSGLLIDRMQWHEMMNFSSDCVLLVLASDVYLESDYIRDYNVFLEELGNENTPIK
ncbi:sugar 3,4-ketoisomerase [Vibrio sinaloensis]|uniref:sugar 3,4-ketoisomerase n=1 Tax=Photobacterium sp. (strain ATCC 43367) TaxID=379097 RepID=UPI00205FD5A6|nr:FdtA/QdtA family cupin domain-containing protein [Vibrio sinaloensis]UPQ88117.1 FdtA/QdtA family cupin domain-containing protein [Vibrio sinaloensis]